MIGFCTAPSRLRAIDRTTVSIRVGSCHDTTAALADPAGVQPGGHLGRPGPGTAPKVRIRSSASISMARSGDASARRSTSSHRVRAPVMICPVLIAALRSGSRGSSLSGGPGPGDCSGCRPGPGAPRAAPGRGRVGQQPADRGAVPPGEGGDMSDPMSLEDEHPPAPRDRKRDARLVADRGGGRPAGVVRPRQPPGCAHPLLGDVDQERPSSWSSSSPASWARPSAGWSP